MIKIEDELKQDFLVYAQEVNNNRAFADARDGLKISQRAVLWEMYDKKYFSNKPHVKSAKVDGGVIANWHPHGSEYTTIVRMSQPWVNNIPEINFHGANGSLIGGPDAAASRYTECRLSEAIEDGLFNSINKETVEFILNYSEDQKWPAVLPAIFPRLFVNGSQGIGYTIAQEWEPGNLTELVEKVKEYISKKKITFNNIYPDYPTGGIIINKKDIEDLYKTGHGTVILRGKTDIIGNYINITELPYQIYAEPFIQKVKDLVNTGTLTGIEDICNKSDDNGLLIEIECSIDPNTVLQKLYKLTDLQCTFSANQMALVNGVPQMLNLQDYIKVYIDHNIECLQREYQFDLNKAVARKEVVDGLIRAISIIDDIISCIKASKSSDEAKKNLITTFSFTENQAKAIVEMRLGKLANLEIAELNKELAELIKIIDKCTKFLASDKLQNKEFIKRLDEFAEKYGWQRHTEVTDIDLAAEKQAVKSVKVEEKYILILTSDNKIKKVSINQFKVSKLTENDVSYVELGAKDRLIAISADGQMYKYEVKNFDACSQNSAGTALEHQIINIFAGTESEPYLFMITKTGLAKKIKAETVFSLSKLAGAPIMTVKEDDTIIYCKLVDDSSIVSYKIKDKIKQLCVGDFLDKGRLAGGVAAIKTTKPFTLV